MNNNPAAPYVPGRARSPPQRPTERTWYPAPVNLFAALAGLPARRREEQA
ncbi:MAG: hypothetical protein ABSB59_15515 [Streptosporangiaceae bacterium]